MSEQESDKLVEKVRTGELLSIYGGLLSDKQGEILRMYCDEDLGFSEIAEELEVTRQAVYDATRQGRASLEKFEEHLKLLENRPVNGENPDSVGSEENIGSRAFESNARIRELFRAIEKTASEDIIYDTHRLRQRVNELKKLLWPGDSDRETN
jgi:predicted DNA-binding protein YlxM (UPF0122 family)